MTKRFNRNRSVVPGERVEDDDGHAAVIPAGGLGLVVALHGDVVVEGARRQPHQPATKRARDEGVFIDLGSDLSRPRERASRRRLPATGGCSGRLPTAAPGEAGRGGAGG